MPLGRVSERFEEHRIHVLSKCRRFIGGIIFQLAIEIERTSCTQVLLLYCVEFARLKSLPAS